MIFKPYMFGNELIFTTFAVRKMKNRLGNKRGKTVVFPPFGVNLKD